MNATRSKSRNVNSYVKAELRRRGLETQLERKRELLKPLERKTILAREEVAIRRQKLNGGQLAEAQRLLEAAATVPANA